jgi:hypothetical protein
MIGDVRTDVPGIEAWASMPAGTTASGLLSSTGDILSPSAPGTNQSIRWAADLTTQIVNGSGNATPTIVDVTRGTLLTATDTRTNNGTKGNPSLVADVFGDWREELLVRAVDSSALRIFTSTEVTTHKLTTLMHDVQYRAEAARQQTTYNQPSYPSYYLASDMDFANVPVLTSEVTPGEPTFKDRPGTADDVVQVPTNIAGVAYHVDGELVTDPSGKFTATGDVTVVAVPTAWYRIADGAISEWSFSFDD